MPKLSDLPLDKSRKDNLPFPTLKSRISTAIILTFKGLQKEVVVIAIKLSKSSRAYIISQEGLPGFLKVRYTNSDSWIYDLLGSAALRSENCFEENDCEALESSLAECKTTNEKELVLRHSFPTTFICFLKSTGRIREVNDLFGKKPDGSTYTW